MNDNIPVSAWNASGAPWDDPHIEPVEEEVEYSCVLYRTTNATTENYEYDVEVDEDGIPYSGRCYDDTDWLKEYKSEHRTPLQLIELLRKTAEKLNKEKPSNFWKEIISECQSWEIGDEECHMM